ncbi:BTB/POZ and MATH domain-containing protein 1-like [Triticum dicoccoides]|uniref:BTB/POZ and MATH domain-containing protein 1-like n=1 Tax=Triticum dicoccoides TaxID=85692 RepID=UPI000E79A923|nr:BTB/POZ and MATH domain-containing protein 1-like [Triticum dicoccoides]
MAERRMVTSAIVAEEETMTHVIKIDGYSRTKELLKAGKCTTSIPFIAGDNIWVVNYFPNGNSKADDYIPGYVSVFLALQSADAKNVQANFTFSLLDKGGEPVCIKCEAENRIFRRKGSNWGFTTFIEQGDLEESVHLTGDSFRLRCDITVLKKIRSEETSPNQFVVIPPSNLHCQLGDLLKNKDGADVAFRVGGEIFSAHRSVLAARSPVFKAELFGAMRERASDPIEILDIEADVFKSLLHFIYTDSLPESTNEGTTQVDVVTASHLLVAADRYDIERLKLICQDKLCNHIGTKMVATSLALAEQHNCQGLKEACFEFLASPSNLEAMIASDGYQHLKSSCPSALKELIARFLPVELIPAMDTIRLI